MRELRRPLIRYHGGKWKLAPWIIANLPPHRVYVEPFGGGGSVLLRKPRSYAEVYNDLDGEIVNLFRVARDAGAELARVIATTPFSRDEYRASFPVTDDPIEQARRTVVRSHMGFGSNALARGVCSGFRSNSNRSGTTPARDWMNLPSAIAEVVGRLRGVVIENRDAAEVMANHDSPDTLHYCDPPYVHATRSGRKRKGSGAAVGYTHEMTDEGHETLAAKLHALDGMVVLSGYRCDLYERMYADWTREDCFAHADGGRDRVECLWFNDAAQQARSQQRLIA